MSTANPDQQIACLGAVTRRIGLGTCHSRGELHAQPDTGGKQCPPSRRGDRTGT